MDSTLSGNSAYANIGLAPRAFGGAIANDTGGTVTIVNSTIAGNSAVAAAASSGEARGGGIYNSSGAMMTIVNSTLSGNSATSQGGGVVASDGGIYNLGTVNATNTLIVNNTPNDVGGNGINGTNTKNLTGVFTFASPLQNNGGPTATFAIPTPVMPTMADAYQQGDLATL